MHIFRFINAIKLKDINNFNDCFFHQALFLTE